jgi:hypothetical protein
MYCVLVDEQGHAQLAVQHCLSLEALFTPQRKQYSLLNIPYGKDRILIFVHVVSNPFLLKW